MNPMAWFVTLCGILVAYDWACGHGEAARLVLSTLFILAAIEFVASLKKEAK